MLSCFCGCCSCFCSVCGCLLAFLSLPPGLIISQDSKPFDNTEYRSLVGSLLYLSIRTRPDIAFAVNLISQQQGAPTEYHYSLGKHVLRYLIGTAAYGITFSKQNRHDVIAYSDANHGDVNMDRHSVSTFVITYNDAPVVWSVKKQTTIALSSTEAEFISLSITYQMIMWYKQLLNSIGGQDKKHNFRVLCDNQGAIKILAEPRQTQKLPKHIDTRYLFVRESVSTSGIPIVYLNTDEMLADILTKPLPAPRFQILRRRLNIIE